MNKDPLIFIEHILENIKNINDFTLNISKETFSKDRIRINAVIRCLEVIGEAVKNIPVSFREKHSTIPWKKIAGSRDIIIHHYFEVDLDIIWSIVKEDLPLLEKQINKIKEELK